MTWQYLIIPREAGTLLCKGIFRIIISLVNDLDRRKIGFRVPEKLKPIVIVNQVTDLWYQVAITFFEAGFFQFISFTELQLKPRYDAQGTQV